MNFHSIQEEIHVHMPTIGLLINPHSKKFQTHPTLIRNLMDQFSDKSKIWLPSTLSELTVCARNIIETRLDYLLICGGDGTFRMTMSELIRNQGIKPLPIVIPLQGGTANLYSMQLYGRCDPLAHLKSALKIIRGKPQSQSLNILKVNDEYGFIFALGGISNFIQYYLTHQRRSISLGIWIAIKLMLSSLYKTSFSQRIFQPFIIDISKNGADPSRSSMTSLSCATIPGYLLKPFIDIETNRRFSILEFTKFPWDLIFEIPAMLANKKMTSRNILQSTASTLSIISADPLLPMVDGDMLPPTRQIHVELGPEIKILKI